MVGVGFAVFGLAVIIPRPISSDLGMLLTAVAACTLMAACLLAWIGNIRTPWTVDDTLDAAVAITVGLICGWGFQLRPLAPAHADLATFIASGLIVAGVIVAYTAIVTLANPAALPLLTASGTILLFVGIAASESSTARRLRDLTDGQPDLWIATGMLSAATLLVLAAYMRPRSRHTWGPTQYFRNTLVIVCFGLGPIAIISIEEIGSSPELTGLAIGVALLATMVAVRYLRFIRHISRLEATRQARDSLFALPFGALTGGSNDSLESMLANVVDLSMRMFQVQRGQLTLMMLPDGSATPIDIDRGLSDTELTVLRTLPRIDPSICLTSSGAHVPLRLRQDDLILPVATKGAWAVVGKTESLCIPITTSEQVIGLLELWSPGKQVQFGELDLAAAQTFGADAGQAIHHAFLTVRTRAQVEQSEMLLTVSEVFSRGQSLHMCVNLVAERLLGHAGSDRITIGLIERDRGAIYIAADVDRNSAAQPSRQGTRVRLEQWQSYREIRRIGHTQAWSAHDSELTPDFRAVMQEFDMGSMMAIPGYLDGRLVVIIQVAARSNLLFDSAETQAVWKLVARQIQFGVESIAALQESRRSEQSELLRRHINE
ncbi:MAG TPA: GAF domain-containing protein, partial [Thermomicrobiales bacterium]|nr:GAF domain-containing protein [Thermomicrobiales bacterium]